MRIGTKSELALAVEILRRAEFSDDAVQDAVNTVHTHLNRLLWSLDDGAPIFTRLDYEYAPPANADDDDDDESLGAIIVPFPLRRRAAQGE